MSEPVMNESSETNYPDIALDKIGESYGRFRQIQPFSEASELRSIKRFGQLSPVVVWAQENGCHEMINGFKRVRA